MVVSVVDLIYSVNRLPFPAWNHSRSRSFFLEPIPSCWTLRIEASTVTTSRYRCQQWNWVSDFGDVVLVPIIFPNITEGFLVITDCDCPPRLFTFNSSSESTVFQSPDYPKAHCRMVRNLAFPMSWQKKVHSKTQWFRCNCVVDNNIFMSQSGIRLYFRSHVRRPSSYRWNCVRSTRWNWTDSIFWPTVWLKLIKERAGSPHSESINILL